eukprot:6175541-Pleurochrysis_carterae.AAC.2
MIANQAIEGSIISNKYLNINVLGHYCIEGVSVIRTHYRTIYTCVWWPLPGAWNRASFRFVTMIAHAASAELGFAFPTPVPVAVRGWRTVRRLPARDFVRAHTAWGCWWRVASSLSSHPTASDTGKTPME